MCSKVLSTLTRKTTPLNFCKEAWPFAWAEDSQTRSMNKPKALPERTRLGCGLRTLTWQLWEAKQRKCLMMLTLARTEPSLKSTQGTNSMLSLTHARESSFLKTQNLSIRFKLETSTLLSLMANITEAEYWNSYQTADTRSSSSIMAITTTFQRPKSANCHKISKNKNPPSLNAHCTVWTVSLRSDKRHSRTWTGPVLKYSSSNKVKPYQTRNLNIR